MSNPTTEEMAREVVLHFGMLACNGKCDRLHLCQKKCAKLTTSIDAWRPIWEAMTDEQWELFLEHICNLSGTTLDHAQDGTISLEEFARMLLLASKLTILTAAYNVVKGE